eukprot:TRINITY_DN104047_c0_g1_i1.p1 TRINITY_DN104047_c0_g1~~TRINITY_DN104047_c0_g1_i1.p1  ORF type:complete len:314 (-),score=33.60 TRINITY_DN104047_c0_g1_i1:261-1202(-)
MGTNNAKLRQLEETRQRQGMSQRSSRGRVGTSSMLDPTASMVPVTISGGPVEDGSAAGDPPTGGDASSSKDKIPVVFTWNHGGQNVYLASSWTGWREQIPMVRSGNQFDVVQELTRGVHQYKFIVDDHWRFAPDQPKTTDVQGNMNNVCDVAQYQRFQVGSLYEKEPAPKLGQVMPDLSDYTLDAPLAPVMLSKSSSSALPPKAPGTGSAVTLNVPIHSISDHVYVQDLPKDSLHTAVAVTHRYGMKYSTTIYATPNDRRTTSKDVEDADMLNQESAVVTQYCMNLLKAAVVRPADLSNLVTKEALMKGLCCA